MVVWSKTARKRLVREGVDPNTTGLGSAEGGLAPMIYIQSHQGGLGSAAGQVREAGAAFRRFFQQNLLLALKRNRIGQYLRSGLTIQ